MMMTDKSNGDDDKNRDETLRRMLNTPPKPHKKGEGEKKADKGESDEPQQD